MNAVRLKRSSRETVTVFVMSTSHLSFVMKPLVDNAKTYLVSSTDDNLVVVLTKKQLHNGTAFVIIRS